MKHLLSSSLGGKDSGESNSYSNDNENDVESGEQTTLIQKMKSTVEIEVNYSLFFIVMGTGLLFILISLLYLPFVVIYPWKFSAFFSFGASVVLLSFVFVYGTWGFIDLLFKKERIAFTLLYLLSVIVGNIITHVLNYYLVVLICAGLQFITVIIFTITFIPGGLIGMKFVFSALRIPFPS